jgi:acyl carrier protein
MTIVSSHQDSLETTVCAMVAETLGRDPGSVHIDSNLMEDLGAESIDFLDIVFRLEQAFDMEITRGEMELAARGDMTDEEFAPAGVISEAGLARLRMLMPEAAERIRPGLRAMEILKLFSVRTFAKIVLAKRDGGSLT